VQAQNPEWLNYTSPERIYALVDDGDKLWIGTEGGLAKLDKTTGEFSFYNRANANLPDNHIRSLALDSSGYLWIGTRYSGIGRFDGNHCKVFNTENSGLPLDQWNTAISIAPDGKILIGSLGFLSVYDGTTWKSYETGSPISSYIAIHDIVFDSKGTAWIGASWGLGKLSSDSLIQGYAGIHNEIFSIAISKNDTLWIGTNGSGLVKFNGQSYTVYDTSNSGIPGNIVFDMKFDSHGNLWLATEKGVAKFDGSNWTIYDKQNSPLTEDGISSLDIDEYGIIWIGTFSSKLFRFDGINWKKFILSSSIFPSNYISTIVVDYKSNVWFGTLEALIRYDRSNWTLYDTSNSGLIGTFNGYISVTKIDFDKVGNLWIGYCGTPWLTRYDGLQWLHYDSTNSPLARVWVTSLTDDSENEVWVGSLSGLVKFDGTTWTLYNSKNTPMTSDAVNDVELDRYGNLWVALGYTEYKKDNGEWVVSFGGLAKFDGKNWYIYDTSNSGLLYPNVGRIAFDSEGIMWVATWYPGIAGIEYGGGLTKFDGTNWTTYDIYNSPLTSNTIFDIVVDKDDNLWLCTCAGGLVKYDRKNNWTIYDQMNSGIAFNSQTTLAIDSFGNKWIAGENNSGLSVFHEGGVILSAGSHRDGPAHPPQSFSLLQNYPNPFNPTTTIPYNVAMAGHVTLIVYDVLGRLVSTLVNENQGAGVHMVRFDGANLASGVYFYKMQVGDHVFMKKMILAK